MCCAKRSVFIVSFSFLAAAQPANTAGLARFVLNPRWPGRSLGAAISGKGDDTGDENDMIQIEMLLKLNLLTIGMDGFALSSARVSKSALSLYWATANWFSGSPQASVRSMVDFQFFSPC